MLDVEDAVRTLCVFGDTDNLLACGKSGGDAMNNAVRFGRGPGPRYVAALLRFRRISPDTLAGRFG